MPIRTLIILAGLLAASFLVILIAWLTDSELYIFFGRFRVKPPTPTGMVAVLLIGALALGIFFSQHYGLVMFSAAAAGVALGTIVGPLLFEWLPSVCQYLLTASMLGLVGYGWTQHEYFDY